MPVQMKKEALAAYNKLQTEQQSDWFYKAGWNYDITKIWRSQLKAPQLLQTHQCYEENQYTVV